MIAAYLYRTCLAMTDMGYGTYLLHYIRTLDKKEISKLINRIHAFKAKNFKVNTCTRTEAAAQPRFQGSEVAR